MKKIAIKDMQLIVNKTAVSTITLTTASTQLKTTFSNIHT